ncbi:MAG: hypothetical protein QE484_08080 [Rhizobium sp.]|nr:hypothetical protein [Rhizobium sp.]
MTYLSRLAAIALYVLALLGIWLLGGSRYDWILDIDPAIQTAAIETDGSRDLVAALCLAAALAASAWLAALGKTRGRWIRPLALALFAIALYGVTRT